MRQCSDVFFEHFIGGMRVAGVLDKTTGIKDVYAAGCKNSRVFVVDTAVPTDFQARFLPFEIQDFGEQMRIGLAAKMAQMAGENQYVIDKIKCRFDDLGHGFGLERHADRYAGRMNCVGKRQKITIGLGMDDNQLGSKRQQLPSVLKRLLVHNVDVGLHAARPPNVLNRREFNVGENAIGQINMNPLNKRCQLGHLLAILFSVSGCNRWTNHRFHFCCILVVVNP
jgi:hypothetical protein